MKCLSFNGLSICLLKMETMEKTNRDAGEMVDRTRRLLTEEDVQRITKAYHAWRAGER